MAKIIRKSDVSNPLPVSGVVGVLAADRRPEEALLQLEGLTALGLTGLEIRADLFREPGESIPWIPLLTRRSPVIFTARNPSQGGNFRGTEEERIALYRAALQAGASAIDVESGSGAHRALAGPGAPLIVSHHDFLGMPPPAQLERLAEDLSELPCRAIKLVPTARRVTDAISILRWLEGRPPGTPARIGFAMAEAGFATRALALARGSAITYASLGPPVAPGQISARELLAIYAPHRRTRATRVLGVVGNPISHSLSPHVHNPALLARGIDAVYLPLLIERSEDLLPAIDGLSIDGLSVTIPWKEEALRIADVADERSRAAGAANTLRIERGPDGGRRAIHAFNTDVEGVLGPLRRRVGDLRGLKAGVIGNGGAARGAVRALLEAGACPTIYYRNEARGKPVADSLGIPARGLPRLRAGDERALLNATPLGLRPGDPSPVAASVFSRGTIAFEMVYEPSETSFLADARNAGSTCIPGREMLVSQAVEQFRIFTGQVASAEELDRNYESGLALRRG